jgi:prepilin-type processing-associated H-X9-DG protein
MFNLDSRYPDYLTDLTLLICPSDPGWSAVPFENPITGETDIWRQCWQGDRGVEIADNSYWYWGHLLDKVDDIPKHTAPGRDVAQIIGWGWGFYDATDIVAAQAALLFMYRFGGSETNRFARMDADINLSPYAEVCPSGCGNGGLGAGIVYRLRDGIERFLITDINNPAAASRGQSEIFVLYDKTSTVVEQFNHVPGGSNVLYLDGHVEFVKYPGPGPVTRAFAVSMGAQMKET